MNRGLFHLYLKERAIYHNNTTWVNKLLKTQLTLPSPSAISTWPPLQLCAHTTGGLTKEELYLLLHCGQLNANVCREIDKFKL